MKSGCKWLCFLLLAAVIPLSGQTCGTTAPIVPVTPGPTIPTPVQEVGSRIAVYHLNVHYPDSLDTTMVDRNGVLRREDGDSLVTSIASAIWIKFDLYGLPKTPGSVYFRLYAEESERDTEALVNLYMLDQPWIDEAGNISPTSYSNGRLIQRLGIPTQIGWVDLDLLDTYLRWTKLKSPNYGFRFNALPNKARISFVSSSGQDPSLRPLLLFRVDNTLPNHKLLFPVKRSPSLPLVSGYRFGKPWESKHCPNDETDLYLHTGTDFTADGWGQPVHAIERGEVLYARADSSEGGYVIVRHGDGTGAYCSGYTHCSPLDWVTTGAVVERGQVVGNIAPGASGYRPHLHFTLRQGGDLPLPLSIRGRLPQVSCVTGDDGDRAEPSFPELFYDPEKIDWDYDG